MPKEPVRAREGRVNPINSTGRAKKIPRGRYLNYDDDIVVVYDAKGKEVERGIYDESVYKGEDMKWNERDGNYDLRYGYKMVVKK